MTSLEVVLAALLKLPVAVEDRADPRKQEQYVDIAHAVSRLEPPAGIPAKDWRALVLAVGAAETHFSLRIMDGACRAWECDRGRARSAWQLHKNLHNAPVWDRLNSLDEIPLQVSVANDQLKRAFNTCRQHSEPVGYVPGWVAPTVRAFAGKSCREAPTVNPWKGIDLRLRYWTVARRAMG